MALIRTNNASTLTLSQYGTVTAGGTHTFSKGSIVVINGATLGSFGSGDATLLQHIQGGARDDMDIYEILYGWYKRCWIKCFSFNS